MSYILTKNRKAFRKRLATKHGKEVLDDFDNLFTRQFWNLADLGRKYGFTRERASQIFQSLYGYGYHQVKARKRSEKGREQVQCSMHFPPRVELLLLETEKRGLTVKKMSNGRFSINEHIIRFYKASAVDYGGYGGKHYRAVFWNDGFDFGIVKAGDQFYIIPRSEFSFNLSSNRRALYIRATPYIRSNKVRCGVKPRGLEKYKEAWNLLDVKDEHYREKKLGRIS